MPRHDLLFSKVDWFSVERHQQEQVEKEVANYNGNRLLNTAVDDLVAFLVDKYLVDVPVLNRDAIVADQREAHVDVSNTFDYGGYDRRGRHTVPGTTVEITIPFSGDSECFSVQPTTYTSNPPRATVAESGLVLEITDVQLNAQQVRSEIDRTISSIESYLDNLRKNAEAFNSSLPTKARQAVEARRQKLLANQSLVSSLGFNLKERPDSARTYVTPSVRRKIVPTPPPASTSAYIPEPALSDKDYAHILDVLENMAHVMERSPSAFSKIDEESLRTHFLVQLNGHYEGQATGETFNYQGKTDILIRAEGKNIFIGECKFWTGPKKLIETIDQLLGYSSWRDTKVAVLVFNRNRDFSKVLQAIRETASDHPNCKRILAQRSETSFRYAFHHKDDSNRELQLTIMAFDVPN